jgi:N-acetylmuramoyl-L-alanine amidase
MSFLSKTINGKTLCSILIGILFCAIIWLSPDAAAPVFSQDDRTVLIIDPGHGGEDGGAVSLDGTRESAINLDIALRLRALCDYLGVPSLMTRETEILAYPEHAKTTAQRKRWDTNRRVEQIHGCPNAVLLSIHQNIYPTGTPRGSQVLYGKGELSKEFGEWMHENLIRNLNPDNRRVAAPVSRDIYIMAHVDCPAILIECGFLSHPQESVLLNTDSYKLKLATVMAGTASQFLEDTNESENCLLLHGMRQ